MWQRLRDKLSKQPDPDTIKNDPDVIAKIQPQGGIKFDANFVRLGDGYLSCLHVYKYQSLVYDYWLEPILNMPGVLTTLDIGTADKRETSRPPTSRWPNRTHASRTRRTTSIASMPGRHIRN